MKIDMLALLRDYNIPFATEGDKHCSPGWANLECPFCDDGSKHLGWNIKDGYFNCWRCGSHNTEDTVTTLLNMASHEVWILLKRYELRPGALVVKEKEQIIRPSKCIVPGRDLSKKHRDYLIDRNYDPDKLAVWQLQGTDHLAKDKFRIICPIYHNDQVVSWQGRDITGKSPLRWKSCPKKLEVRDHKHCLGGSQLATGDSVVVVEGFTDAWRFGPGAVCTFGTDYLIQQVSLLRKWKRRFVVLDSAGKDPNAMVQADKLCNILSAFPGETILCELDKGDPGDLPQREADYLMNSWGIRK
jgi:hypothetical protein